MNMAIFENLMQMHNKAKVLKGITIYGNFSVLALPKKEIEHFILWNQGIMLYPP